MTEAEWNSSTNPQAMLEFLRDSGRLSYRKLRLFAVACCRSVWDDLPDGEGHNAVEVGEMFADGLTTSDARNDAWVKLQVAKESAVAEMEFERALWLRHCQSPVYGKIEQGVFLVPHTDARAKCSLLRCIAGPLAFRQVTIFPPILRWNEGTVVKLAQPSYEARSLPEGTMDPARLAVLADALEDAGCEDAEILEHLRRQETVHVRGCWPVDLVLGRN
jgi:hypothetical protein